MRRFYLRFKSAKCYDKIAPKRYIHLMISTVMRAPHKVQNKNKLFENEERETLCYLESFDAAATAAAAATVAMTVALVKHKTKMNLLAGLSYCDTLIAIHVNWAKKSMHKFPFWIFFSLFFRNFS